MDDTYERLVIGGKVVVKLEVVNKDIQVTPGARPSWKNLGKEVGRVRRRRRRPLPRDNSVRA